MSHDRNGTPIRKGDRVMVEFEVVNVFPDADPKFCNCSLKSVLPMPGNDSPCIFSAISTQQVVLVEKAKE